MYHDVCSLLVCPTSSSREKRKHWCLSKKKTKLERVCANEISRKFLSEGPARRQVQGALQSASSRTRHKITPTHCCCHRAIHTLVLCPGPESESFWFAVFFLEPVFLYFGHRRLYPFGTISDIVWVTIVCFPSTLFSSQVARRVSGL